MEKNEAIEKFRDALKGKLYVTFRGKLLQPTTILKGVLHPLVATDGDRVFFFTEDGYDTPIHDEDCQDRLQFYQKYDWTTGLVFKSESGELYIVIEAIAPYDANTILSNYRYRCVRLSAQPEYEHFNEVGISELGTVREYW